MELANGKSESKRDRKINGSMNSSDQSLAQSNAVVPFNLIQFVLNEHFIYDRIIY